MDESGLYNETFYGHIKKEYRKLVRFSLPDTSNLV
jgi:hypothetical protein